MRKTSCKDALQAWENLITVSNLGCFNSNKISLYRSFARQMLALHLSELYFTTFAWLVRLRQFQIIKDLQSNASGSVHLAKTTTGGVDVVVLKRRKVLSPEGRDSLGGF